MEIVDKGEVIFFLHSENDESLEFHTLKDWRIDRFLDIKGYGNNAEKWQWGRGSVIILMNDGEGSNSCSYFLWSCLKYWPLDLCCSRKSHGHIKCHYYTLIDHVSCLKLFFCTQVFAVPWWRTQGRKGSGFHHLPIIIVPGDRWNAWRILTHDLSQSHLDWNHNWQK